MAKAPQMMRDLQPANRSAAGDVRVAATSCRSRSGSATCPRPGRPCEPAAVRYGDRSFRSASARMRRSMSVTETMPTGRRASSTTTARSRAQERRPREQLGDRRLGADQQSGIPARDVADAALSAIQPAARGARRRWSARRRARPSGVDDRKGAEEVAREPDDDRRPRSDRSATRVTAGAVMTAAAMRPASSRSIVRALRLGSRGDDEEAADQGQPEAAHRSGREATAMPSATSTNAEHAAADRGRARWPARDPPGAATAARARPGRRRAGRRAGG